MRNKVIWKSASEFSNYYYDDCFVVNYKSIPTEQSSLNLHYCAEEKTFDQN